MAYELAIVLPTFNESGNVQNVVERLKTVLKGVHYEVIFVDDDSPDGTAALVRQISQSQNNVRVLHRIGRRGLSSACIEGILAASAPYVAVMDADMQHDETILPAMLRRIRDENLDLVVGSRNIAGGGMGQFSNWRVKLSHFGRRLSTTGATHALTDPMSGFFIVRFSTFERLAHRLSALGFKILLDIVLSAEQPLKIAEVAYQFRLREHGESKLDVMVGVEYLELLADKRIGKFINIRFVLFCMVGAFGVAVHLTILKSFMLFAALSFAKSQAITTLIVMTVNYILNKLVTYSDRRLRGRAFWIGLLSFYLACGLGLVINVAVSNEAFHHGISWLFAALIGLIFSAVWNYGVTSVTTWRQKRISGEKRARRRLQAEMHLHKLHEGKIQNVESERQAEESSPVNL